MVFADLTEAVRRTGSLSPEEATRLVNPLLEAMVDLMVRHGGRIDRFLGDGVLAVFGVPVAHEDDPIRAVRAAVDLRERAMSLGVSVTAGVNTGRVYFGPVGSALHEELDISLSGADPGRVAEGYFAAGFTLLWADRVDEAAEMLEQAVARTGRVGDVVEECRARAYHAVALRRAGRVRVDEAETAAEAALEIATELDNGYYQGHAYGVLSWVEWRRGSGRCAELGDMAYRAWGTATREGHAGLGTEFAWIAALPLAADAWERDEPEAGATHLRNVLVSWERPLPDDLRELVGRAVSGDADVFGEIFDLAGRYRLL